MNLPIIVNMSYIYYFARSRAASQLLRARSVVFTFVSRKVVPVDVIVTFVFHKLFILLLRDLLIRSLFIRATVKGKERNTTEYIKVIKDPSSNIHPLFFSYANSGTRFMFTPFILEKLPVL